MFFLDTKFGHFALQEATLVTLMLSLSLHLGIDFGTHIFYMVCLAHKIVLEFSTAFFGQTQSFFLNLVPTICWYLLIQFASLSYSVRMSGRNSLKVAQGYLGSLKRITWVEARLVFMRMQLFEVNNLLSIPIPTLNCGKIGFNTKKGKH